MKMVRVSMPVFLLSLLVVFSGCVTVAQDENLEARVSDLEVRVDKLDTKNVKAKKVVKDQTGLQKETKDMEIVGSSEELDDQKVVIRFPSNAEIQIALKNAGFYTGVIDGQLGRDTRNAIMEFQKDNGLRMDGVIGRNTWEILGEFFVPEELAEEQEEEAEILAEEIEEDELEADTEEELESGRK